MSQPEKQGVIGGRPSSNAVQSKDDGKLPASSSSVSVLSSKSGSIRSKEGAQLQAARKLAKEVDDNLQVRFDVLDLSGHILVHTCSGQSHEL